MILLYFDYLIIGSKNIKITKIIYFVIEIL